jgi:tRNA(Ile)-lysidine synthase
MEVLLFIFYNRIRLTDSNEANMKIKVKPGLYILATSGGVDSMVLLDMLSKKPDLKLIVAHFNHGIRPESAAEERFVVKSAGSYGLPAAVGHGRLGPKTSEGAARQARYKFLESTLSKHKAKAVITAHHQDDLLETAILNTLRGTGAQGLVSMASNKKVVRPMLKVPKAEIIKYAKSHGIKWVEDQSNKNTRYARNYVRSRLMPKLNQVDRQKLVDNLDKVANIQNQKTELIATLSRNIVQEGWIDRYKFINLPASVSDELTHYWLSTSGSRQTTRPEVKRVSALLKTAKPGRKFSISKELTLEVEQKNAHLRTRG